MFLLILCGQLMSANGLMAQSVRVQNGLGDWGYGWMFGHAGNCYAALPEHVAGPLPKVTIATAAPVESDQATIVKPFWPGIDLAVAVLDRGPLDARCTAELDDLVPPNAERNAAHALVLRVTPVGEQERLPIRILDRDYLKFTGELTRDGDAIGQGTSGAFAFVDEQPIGMALTSDDENRADFMRAEEIALNIGRYLSEQGRAFSASPSSAPAALDAGLALRGVHTNTPPVLPQFGPENTLGDGLFVTRPNGPVVLTFRLNDQNPVAVRRLRMIAPPDGEHTVPKAIVVELDAGTGGDRFRFWTRGEMRPDGVFDTGPLAGRNARWIRVTIQSAWSEGTIAVDRVVVE